MSGDPNDKVMVTEDKAMYGQMYGQSLLLKKETVISNSGANTQTNVSGMDLKLGWFHKKIHWIFNKKGLWFLHSFNFARTKAFLK